MRRGYKYALPICVQRSLIISDLMIIVKRQ